MKLYLLGFFNIEKVALPFYAKSMYYEGFLPPCQIYEKIKNYLPEVLGRINWGNVLVGNFLVIRLVNVKIKQFRIE